MNRSLNPGIAAAGSKRTFRNLRWWVLVLFLAGVTVNYITRNSLGILAPELKTSLGITTEQYSWIVGAFQLAYTFFQPICGWLIDVIGLKVGFLICASVWAVACLFHAGAASWVHLAILRFVMGGAEAAATPANAKVLGEWFPKKSVRLQRVGRVWASQLVRCWHRPSSTSRTPLSAGRALSCSPVAWRWRGWCSGGCCIAIRKFIPICLHRNSNSFVRIMNLPPSNSLSSRH